MKKSLNEIIARSKIAQKMIATLMPSHWHFKGHTDYVCSPIETTAATTTIEMQSNFKSRDTL